LTTPPEPTWASLEVVRQELDIEREIQAKRGDGADTRAGVVLGFAGALAALAVTTKTLLALPGALTAVAAAICATRVFWPRPQNTVEPVNLLRLYVTQQPEEARKAVLKRRAADYDKNKEWVDTKNKWLKIAVTLLTAAIVLLVVGVSVRLILNALRT
jgi:hypothetical protein